VSWGGFDFLQKTEELWAGHLGQFAHLPLLNLRGACGLDLSLGGVFVRERTMSDTPRSRVTREANIRNSRLARRVVGNCAVVERMEDRLFLSTSVKAPAIQRSLAPADSNGDAPGQPTIAAIPNASDYDLLPFSYQVVATGTPAPTFSLSKPPAGMAIDTNSGLITWTPTVSEVGTYTVSVRAANSVDSISTSFTITVNQLVAPVITTPIAQTAIGGAAYSYQIATTASPATAFTLTNAPTGMTISSTGLISWSPALGSPLGAQNVTVVASNVVGSGTVTFPVTVIPDNVAPTPPTLTLGTINTVNSIPLSWTGATDNVGVVSYNLYAWTPAVYRGHSGRGGGITLVSPAKYTLLVSGVTSTSYTFTGLAPLSSYNYAVAAVDAAGNVSTPSNIVTGTTLELPSIGWTLDGVNMNPTVSDVANHALDITLVAGGSPYPTVTLLSAPAGVTLNQGLYLPSLTWTPTNDETGVNNIVIEASNSVGQQTITIPVTVTPDLPQISVSVNGAITYTAGQFAAGQGIYNVLTNPGFGNLGGPSLIPQYAVAGTPITFQVTSTSYNGDPQTLALASGPAGLNFDPTTGIGTWTPTVADAGLTTVTITSTNTVGTSTLNLSFPTYFTTAPGTPTAVYQTSASGTANVNPTLNWTPPADAADVTDYQISLQSASSSVTTVIDTHSTATSYALSGLTSGQYFASVVAVDASGASSIASNSMSFYGAAVPTLTWTTVPAGTLGTPLGVQFAPTTGSYSYSILSGPAGATIDSATGLLSWTPTVSGTVPFVIAATNLNGWGSVDATINVQVAQPAWLSASSQASWNSTTGVLTVTGPTTITSDPGSADPIIQASGSAAVVTIAPATGSQIHFGGLSLTNGASLNVASLGVARSVTNYNVLVVGIAGSSTAPLFNIDSTSTLDLADADMAILYGGGAANSPLTAVQSAITSAYDNGAWDGAGLTSSVAATASGNMALGYGEASTLGYTSFDGVALGGNAVLVKYTLVGDTTLSGSVGATDLQTVVSNFDGSSTAGWTDGDFYYTGSVGGQDYQAVLANYDTTLADVLTGA
jgi:hypothetical protein